MKTAKFTIGFLLLTIGMSYSFQSSSESVNPFNQFMSPSGGVDLYSGAAALSIPLVQLPGIKGTEVNIGLTYSSNVMVNARSLNKNGPTPWVGLGWNLGSSSISCDHKGTATHTDDDFYLISEIGVPSRLIKPNRVRYKYYEGSITTLDNLSTLPLKETGKCSYFNIRRSPMPDQEEKAESFAFVFESKIKLDYNGNYTFYLNSDDGSRLYINNELIVDNDGTHSPQERSGTKALNSGSHNLRVEFFQAAGGRELWVGYSHETAFSKKQIPIDVLFDPETDDQFNGKQFFVENNPYIKCEPQDLNGDGVYEGWVVTNIDGSKLMFGNLSFGEDHKATRNVFRQGNFAGLVTNGTPVLFPYAWDLVASMDVAGNSTQYWYQQEEEAIHSGTFMSDSLSTPQKYTKASYPYIIRSSSGHSLKITLESKNSSGFTETFDPYQYSSEPDAFMEMYESKRLKTIEVFIPGEAAPVKVVDFTYDYLNKTTGNQFLKSLIKEITWKDNASGKLENRFLFDYYDDVTKADTYEPDYHYGALKEITNTMLGSSTRYTYTQMSLDESKETHPVSGVTWGVKNAQYYFIRDLENGGSGPYIHGNKGVRLYGGTYDNGKEYILVLGGHRHDRLWLYTFNGHTWEQHPDFQNRLFDYTGEKDVIAFHNGFLYKTTEHSDDNAKIVFWQNGKWNVNDITIKNNGNFIDEVKIGNDFLVCRGGNGGDYKDKIWVYRRYENEWLPDKQYFDKDFLPGMSKTKLTAVGENFFVVTGGGDFATIIRWNGTSWDQFYLPIPGENKYREPYAGNNYVVITAGSGSESTMDYIYLYYWDGKQWKVDPDHNNTALGKVGADKIVYPASGYFVVKKKADTRDQVWFVTWNGNAWVDQQLGIPPGYEHYVDVYPGPDYIIVRGGDPEIFDRFYLYNKVLNPVGSVCWAQDPDFGWIVLQDTVIENGEPKVKVIRDQFVAVPGSNGFAITTTGASSPNGYMYRWIYRHDGSKWNKIFSSKSPSGGDWDEINESNRYGICATTSGFGFATTRYDYNCAEGVEIQFVHRFQDNFESIQTYLVTQKEVFSAAGATPLTTAYTYENSHFDARAGAFKFNKVTVSNSDAGSSVNYYFNDSEYDNQHTIAGFGEFDGMVYLTKTFNENGTVIAQSSNNYELFKADYWPEGIWQKRIRSTASRTDNVPSRIEYSYNNENGLPNLTKTQAPDGLERWSKTKFAYEDPAYASVMGFAAAYMLSQPSEIQIQRKELPGSTAVTVGATATTYANNLGCNAWLPSKSYAWRTPVNSSSGVPDATFTSFIPGNANVNWTVQSEVTRYNTIGNPVESLSPDRRRYNNTIYRTGNILPVGSVSNARYGECLFTDFSVNDIEAAHTHAKSPVMASADGEHLFSSRGVRVEKGTGYSDGQNNDHYVRTLPSPENPGITSLADRTFVIDFWARSNLSSARSFIHLQTDQQYKLSSNSMFDLTDKWQKYSVEVTFGDDVSTNDKRYRVVLRPPATAPWAWDPTEGAKVFYDDIRVYPKGALMTTTYYDSKWEVPVLTLDVNNNPGDRVWLDATGKPEKVLKFVNKSTNEMWALASGKFNWTVGSTIELFNPNGGETFPKGSSIDIRWDANSSISIVKLYFSTDNGLNWSLISSVSQSDTYWGKYQWVTPNIAGNYLVKVTKDSEPAVNDISDFTFRLY